MSTYKLVARAVAEIDEIASYTAERWGRGKSIDYIRELTERFVWLATNPMLGRSRDDLREGIRSWRQESHMIFYRIIENGIEIIGIPYASADFVAYFDS